MRKVCIQDSHFLLNDHIGPQNQRMLIQLIAHLYLLVRVTSEPFLQGGTTFKVGLANESHWLQPMLVLTVHW